MTSVLSSELDPRTAAFTATPRQMYIDGQWVEALSGRRFDTVDPATERVITTVPHSGPEDVDRAVTAARRAFESGPWPSMTPAERQRLVWRIAEGITARADQFAELESIDNGKSVAVAKAVDVTWAAEIFYYYAGWATKIEGRTIPVSVPWAPDNRFHAFTLREPVGVCAQIVPWNFPLVMAAFKVAPALACGNTVILKPAEQTPLTAVLLAEVIAEAGVPDGVFNLLTGFGDTGAALSAHPDVDKVAFTGSTEVGRKIVHAAEGNLKKVSLELGGKSPQVVFADADLAAAIPGVASGFLFNHGQTCTAGTRLLVEDAIFNEFTAGVAEHAANLRIGPGLDPTNDIGPLVSREQLTKVTGYLDAGVAQGARALTGGGRHGDTGFYVQPTLLVDVRDDFSVYREEIFGPVAVAVPFSRAQGPQALKDMANDTPYGLAASVWTRDVSTAHQVTAQIKAGTVWVNCHNAFDTALPFGGYKQSGWGRELGEGAIAEYTQTKAVNIAL
ncbi:aldehyde dehydrogenase family protein [Mycobacterium sp. AMU20-3851]|uniref:aldehyde dehydrogenase family protein n=1 Tax=Mycobacterium sp. AMU20-3851 TaxID=3122055 RepID=UPI003754EE1D